MTLSADITVHVVTPTLPMHLLVVDDDDVDRERVLRLLGRSTLNFDAKEAASSADALRLLREHEFDCVMLDHRLGDASGAALLPAIRQVARRDCPVIMITGAGNESLAVQALQLGAADYLTKFNLDADMLVRAIQRALEHHRLRRELADLHQRLEQRVAQQAAAIRQNERDLRATLDATPTVIGSWDRGLRNRFGNRAWRGWAGIDPALLPGRHLAEVVGAAVVERIAGHVDAVLRGERRHFELALPADASHAERHAQWTLLPDLADDGTVRGFYSSITDVSSIRQAQAALVAARDAAEQATRAKSQFLANMSHEIRTPMNAIVGLTQLALTEGLPTRTQTFIDTAHQSARALMGILDDVLDYSKVEAGELRLELQPLDLVQVVRRCADLFSARIAEKGLAFTLELAPGLPRRVQGDALRLSQVLNNLLGNAVKFTEQGRVRLEVRPAAATDASGAAQERVQFVVHDSGVGVAPAHQAGLFEAFTQADNSITRRFGGTGLGLAICRRLVTMMGGEIGFDSRPGEGSAFWFTVPLQPLEAAAAEADADGAPVPADAAPPPATVHAQPLRGLRLLLVEDNDTNRLVARIWLERLGAVVLQAGDGAQALALLQDGAAPSVDAVLMDMHMPVMDGLEATRRLHALPALQQLPVIGMTAAALAEDRRHCLDAGMVDHVTKPIVVEQLVTTLLRWTGRPLPPAGAGDGLAEAPVVPPVVPPVEPVALTLLPGFDLAGLREMLHGNETLLLRMLAMFAAQEAHAGTELAALLAAGDVDAACGRLHQLRGGAGAVGALQLAAAAADFERALRAGRPAVTEQAAFDQALGAALAAVRGLAAGDRR